MFTIDTCRSHWPIHIHFQKRSHVSRTVESCCNCVYSIQHVKSMTLTLFKISCVFLDHLRIVSFLPQRVELIVSINQFDLRRFILGKITTVKSTFRKVQLQ